MERVYRGWRGVGFHHPEAGYVCGVYPRDELELLFEHGASLPDPDGLLKGDGTQTRTLVLRSEDEEMRQAISTFLHSRRSRSASCSAD